MVVTYETLDDAARAIKRLKQFALVLNVQPTVRYQSSLAFPTQSGQFAYVHWTANCRSNSTGLTCPSVEWRRDGL